MTPSPRDAGEANRSSRRIAVLLALAALGTGCVRQGGPDVKVTALDAELVFGVKEKGESAPTPPELAPAPMDADFGGFTPFSGNGFDIPLSLQSEPDDCPDEIIQAIPERDADVTITNDAANGLYSYKGAFLIHRPDTQGGDLATTRPDEIREIRNYKRTANLITYDYIQPFGTNFLKSSYQVKLTDTIAGPGGSQVPAPSYKPDGQGVVDSPPRVRSDPEGGVVLKRTEVINASGKRVAGTVPFEPETGLLLLPLPIQSEDFVSSATDEASGRTIVNQARVLARDRVNACGEPVEGWLVNGAIAISDSGDRTGGFDQFTRPDGANYDNQYTWNYILAPQYGGLLIGEQIRRANDRAKPARFPESTIRSLNNIDPK